MLSMSVTFPVWQTGTIRFMDSMFAGCTPTSGYRKLGDPSLMTPKDSCVAMAFNQPLASWKVTKLGSHASAFNSMFDGATAFNQNINSWQWSWYSKPTKFYDLGFWVRAQKMFQNASAFNQPLGAWQTRIYGADTATPGELDDLLTHQVFHGAGCTDFATCGRP